MTDEMRLRLEIALRDADLHRLPARVKADDLRFMLEELQDGAYEEGYEAGSEATAQMIERERADAWDDGYAAGLAEGQVVTA